VVPLKIGLRRAHLVSDPAAVRHVLLGNIGNCGRPSPRSTASSSS
jgi:hypothetical protein